MKHCFTFKTEPIRKVNLYIDSVYQVFITVINVEASEQRWRFCKTKKGKLNLDISLSSHKKDFYLV